MKDGHKKVDTVADSVLVPSSSAQKRKPDEMDSEELEARKRRKLQVIIRFHFSFFIIWCD